MYDVEIDDGYRVDALVTDFDSTLSVKNTTPGVMEIIYRHADEPDATREEMGGLIDAYFAEKREAVEGGGNMEEMLERWSRIERKYSAIVAPYFTGVTREEMKEEGYNVELREHAGQAVDHLRSAGVSVAVDTNNWSSSLVTAALEGRVSVDDVYPNRLVYGDDDVCTGEMLFDNVDPLAKRDALLDYKQKTGARQVAYVGDDLNDLACMVVADIAFAIKPSDELLGAIQHYGIEDHVRVVESWDEIEGALRTNK